MAERDDRAGWQASLPPRWMNDSTYKGLSVNAWALLTWTLAWGVGQENDGRVKHRDLPFIAAPMLNTSESLAAAKELVEVGLWEVVDDGYQVVRWEQSQPTSAEIEARRATWRRQKQGKPKPIPPGTPSRKPGVSTAESGRIPERSEGVHVRTNATDDKNATDATTRTAGTMREATGKGPTFGPGAEVDERTGEVTSWPTAVPGEPDSWVETAPGEFSEVA